MADPEIRSFEDFWPFYVRAHRKPLTRTLHAIGTSVGAAVALAGLATGRRRLVPTGFVIGYAFAWYSHFFVEGNKPATFGHPLYSFKADWIMLGKILSGTMDAEVARWTADEESPAPASERAPADLVGDGVLH